MEHRQMNEGTSAPVGDEVAGGDGDVSRLVGSDRVLAVLKELARYPDGVGLEELTRVIGSPKPTVHRALVALRRAGLADQGARGRYVLGDEFLRMAFAHHEDRPEHVRVRPVLEALAHRFGETAHYAVLDGREVVYRAKVDPPTGGVRLTSTVGGRNPAHATGVGKTLLAHRLDTVAAVEAWIGDSPLEHRTARTLRTAADLYDDLRVTRDRGYAVDDQENEAGVNCLSLPVYLTSPTAPSGAVSVSALTYRTPLHTLVDAVDEIRALLGPLAEPRR
ncbi:IclR family transcriptional regulator [Streptomyces sp. WI04-05B]|uniref:IclR family transcriptional regulator n=1 Tax=Streptomyces TaxID=1883 RepID=UPI0029BDBC07|nr:MULTISPECIES: IclR family transcriptional regulator [unclassified Streptomyces]MDX2541678.1 IclR family transcriptional regulator [Streptomyces sp. WI04-05B]MDX2583588.1 IclR family transcriptional regulator [Streptomyces sp. WI04-05A]MDX3745366.1 IclR family transcriptional regulator [Streptomyces sp. AK08-02]